MKHAEGKVSQAAAAWGMPPAAVAPSDIMGHTLWWHIAKIKTYENGAPNISVLWDNNARCERDKHRLMSSAAAADSVTPATGTS
eukprot:gene3000-3281_t